MSACLCLQAKAYMWMLLSLWQWIDSSASQANTNSAFSYKYCVLTLFYFNQKDTHSLAALLGTPTMLVKSRHLGIYTRWRQLAKVELSVRMVENVLKWLKWAWFLQTLCCSYLLMSTSHRIMLMPQSWSFLKLVSWISQWIHQISFEYNLQQLHNVIMAKWTKTL